MSRELRKEINYYWRLWATGTCFLCFGLGCVSALLSVLPLRIVPLPTGRREELARRFISWHLRIFIQLMTATGVLKLELKGFEKLQRPGAKLVVANHPTLIDAVVLLAMVPDIACVVKSGLTQSFVIREIVKSTGYITNSKPLELLEECAKLFSSGHSLLLFPEGTRSTPGKPLRFLRGAAQVSLRANQDLTLVAITCSPPSLLKGQKWYQVPRSGPVTMVFEVLEELEIAPFQCEKEGISLRSRKLTRHLTDTFQQHLHWPSDPQREI